MTKNKYEKFFSPEMSPNRVSTVFYSLCDEAKKRNELDELKVVFLLAYRKAEKKEAFERYGM